MTITHGDLQAHPLGCVSVVLSCAQLIWRVMDFCALLCVLCLMHMCVLENSTLSYICIQVCIGRIQRVALLFVFCVVFCAVLCCLVFCVVFCTCAVLCCVMLLHACMSFCAVVCYMLRCV